MVSRTPNARRRLRPSDVWPAVLERCNWLVVVSVVLDAADEEPDDRPASVLVPCDAAVLDDDAATDPLPSRAPPDRIGVCRKPDACADAVPVLVLVLVEVAAEASLLSRS
jgi:hypothetical protein